MMTAEEKFRIDEALLLLNEAAEYFEGSSPNDVWFRRFYLLTGQHMIRTDEGWQPAENKQELIEEYGEDVILEEVNTTSRPND